MEPMTPGTTAEQLPIQEQRQARLHKQKFSVAWWLKLVGLAPLGIIAAYLLFATGFYGHNPHTYLSYAVAAAVTGAVTCLGWHRPGLVGLLILVLLTPFGLVWWGYASGGIRPSTSDLVIGALPLAFPVVSGLMLIVAGLWRKRNGACPTERPR
jgi:hypothetical protein